MYRLHCRNLNYACDHPGHGVTGNTKEEVWERMMELCKREHYDGLAEMTPDQIEELKKSTIAKMAADNGWL